VAQRIVLASPHVSEPAPQVDQNRLLGLRISNFADAAAPLKRAEQHSHGRFAASQRRAHWSACRADKHGAIRHLYDPRPPPARFQKKRRNTLRVSRLPCRPGATIVRGHMVMRDNEILSRQFAGR